MATVVASATAARTVADARERSGSRAGRGARELDVAQRDGRRAGAPARLGLDRYGRGASFASYHDRRALSRGVQTVSASSRRKVGMHPAVLTAVAVAFLGG
jgi:hypothetical protein